MITLYSGTPGSGKSYHAVKDMVFKIRRSRKNTVISNVAFDFSGVKGAKGQFFYVPNERLTVDYLLDFAREHHDFSGSVRDVEGQTLVVIDECQTFFNPREFSKKDRLPWINFFTMHRHLGYNFILISQFDRLLDRQIRNNLEYEVKHRKVNNFKLGCLIPVPLFICVECWYGIREKSGVEFMVFRKKYGNLYASVRNILFADKGPGFLPAGGGQAAGAPQTGADGSTVSGTGKALSASDGLHAPPEGAVGDGGAEM